MALAYLIQIIREIKAVGFLYWVWFALVLKRNEFHSSLDLNLSNNFSMKEAQDQLKILNRKRDLAHAIDFEFDRIEYTPMFLSDVVKHLLNLVRGKYVKKDTSDFKRKWL
jgi:hypothetical protein